MKMKYCILSVVAVLSFIFLLSKTSLSHDTSVVIKKNQALKLKILNMPYDKARKFILDRGWQPVKNAKPDELRHYTRDIYKKGYIEVAQCSSSMTHLGVTPCNFYFKKKGDQYLLVHTSGEEPHVRSVHVLNSEEFKKRSDI